MGLIRGTAILAVFMTVVAVVHGAVVDTPSRPEFEGVNEEAVERHIRIYVNENRSTVRGLPALEQRDDLKSLAEDHARNMSEYSYMSHKSPKGVSGVERFRRRGILESCAVPGENVGRIGEVSQRDGGDTQLANITVRGWRISPPHRRTMYAQNATEFGVGAAYNQSEDKLYVSLVMC